MRVAWVWPYIIGFLAHVLLEQRQAEEAARVIDRGDFPDELQLDQIHLIWFRIRRAQLRIETGMPQRGVEELLQVGETVQLIPFDNPGTAPWRRWAAEGLRLLARTQEARALVEDELALARRWGDPQTIGASLRVLGLVEGGRAGIGLLREAVDVLAATPAQLEYARALVDLGAALRRANQRTEARERLREGVDLAQNDRCVRARHTRERRDCRDWCEAEKGHPDGARRPYSERASCSSARSRGDEQQGDRANALFVTVKTVEVHLSHA